MKKNHNYFLSSVNSHEQSMNTVPSTIHLLTNCIICFFNKVNSSE